MPRAIHWVTWSALVVGLQGAGQFILLAVLARHLTAAEFGLVTATLIAVNLGRMLTQSAPGPALVQRRELAPQHIRSAFALTGYGAVAMLVCVWFAAPPVARFFRMEGLDVVMRSLSFVFLLQAPGLVPEALLHREMRFRALAVCEGVSFLLGYVMIGILLAVTGAGIWSLVAAHLGHALVKTGALVCMRPHPRSLLLDRAATHDLLFISGGFLAGRFFTYSAAQGDNFVVARWMLARDLGLYGRAYQLMAMPAMFLGEVIDKILFPLLAKSQEDSERLRSAYERGVTLIAATMIPVSIAGVILGPEIVRVVLGPGWEDVVLPFQILMGGLVFRTGYKLSDCLARATGAVYARAWRQAIYALIVFGGAFFGRKWGIEGVAVGILGAIILNYVMMSWLSLLTTDLSWSRFVLAHGRGIVVGSVFGAATFLVAEGLRGLGGGDLFVLLVTGAAITVTFGVAASFLPRLVIGPDGLWIISTLLSKHNEDRDVPQEGASAPRPSRIPS